MDIYISSFVFIFISSKIIFSADLSLSRLFDFKYLTDVKITGEILSFIFFQSFFCCTCVTIISGAIAERVKFSTYAFIAASTSLLIYPVFARISWNGLGVGKQLGFLDEQGFIDFAGSIVVHANGGWISLALLIIIVPRKGRFNEQGNPKEFFSSNLGLATCGAFLLWIGWFGFNCGSTLSPTTQTPLIFLNTLVASSGSLFFCFIIKSGILKQKVQVPYLLNSILAGAVAVTACTPYISVLSAFVMGVLGGIACLMEEKLILKYKIDDAVSAIPVHLFGGVCGALCLPFFVAEEFIPLDKTRLEFFYVQLEGVVLNFLWAFGSAFILFWVWN